jgi:DNA invertase Pin-like site-specific DNA recombinase
MAPAKAAVREHVNSKLAAAFVRVSTGSQDESSQVKLIDTYAAEHEITIVKRFKLHGYSASHGTQEPALREAIADIERGDYATLIVTESSRLDRREDLDAQAEILLSIRSAGGDILSITEPQFGRTDFAGRVVTLVAQHANAQKSRTVKDTTYRGMTMIRDNNAYYGYPPVFWKAKGERYHKQAYCVDGKAVAEIYRRVADGESLSSIARSYTSDRSGKTLWVQSLRKLIRFTANHTGVIECSYTYEGESMTWTHEVTPVVDSALWWRANKVLDANDAGFGANKGGRPPRPNKWISGVLTCPACGEKVFLLAGLTPARDSRTGKPRVQRPVTPKLYCGGTRRDRRPCGQFKGCLAQPVIDGIESMFAGDNTPILAFQRVAGNAHELEELKATLPKLQSQLSVITDRATRRETLAQIEALEDRIESFEVIPDDFDYASTGQTVAQMWNDADETVKRGIVRAVKESWGMTLVYHEGKWVIDIGTEGPEGTNGIVDLGNGLCFRRKAD